MKVQIITNDNGFGLTQDIAILTDAIARIDRSIQVKYTHWRKPGTERYDLNVFLELVNPAFFDKAKRNVLVPNPEWFDGIFRPHLRRFDEVWAKTVDASRIFRGLVKRVEFVGWTSIDRGSEYPPWRQSLLHVAGASSAKGTAQLFRAMASLPDHHLTVITKDPWPDAPRNITQQKGLTNAQVTEAMRTHKIHVCPSSYEGFGHYINEARSARAVIITTNAAPMNELVRPEFGLGASVISTSGQNMAQHKHVDIGSLAHCITLAMRASNASLEELGQRARRAFETERDQFWSNLETRLRA